MQQTRCEACDNASHEVPHSRIRDLLQGTAISDAQINLSWNASIDNVGVAGYRVFRNGTLIASVATTSYADSGLSASTTYSYTVLAFDFAGNLSAQSAPVQVTTLATQPTPPTFVQVNYAAPQAAQSSVPVAFTSAQTAGNTNIVAIGWNDATANIVSVTDSKGNIYQPALATFRGSGLSQAIYYANNISAGGNSVTVTFDQAAQFVDLRTAEYSGIASVSPVDVGASASGSSAAASSPSITTAGSNELLFAAGMTITSFSSPGTGFTSRVITSPDGDIVMDRVAQTPGSYSASASMNGSGAWIMQVVAFKPR